MAGSCSHRSAAAAAGCGRCVEKGFTAAAAAVVHVGVLVAAARRGLRREGGEANDCKDSRTGEEHEAEAEGGGGEGRGLGGRL